MKIFLSHSGARSRKVAELFHDWLPSVIQSLDPWVSTNIEKGAGWKHEIHKGLEKAGAGIICVTMENRSAPWILFEAGALQKGLDQSRVCTFLVDLPSTELDEPLGGFQNTQPDYQDVLKLVKNLNSYQDEAQRIPDARVEKTFEKFWSDFDVRFKKILGESSKATGEKKSDSTLIAETLEAVRGVQRSISDLTSTLEYQSGSPVGFTEHERLLRALRDIPTITPNPLKVSQSMRDVLTKGGGLLAVSGLAPAEESAGAPKPAINLTGRRRKRRSFGVGAAQDGKSSS